MNNIAGVLVEPRNVKQVYLNIENFFSVLPELKLYFFCGKNLKQKHLDYLEKNNINHKNLVIIELHTNNLNFITYSSLFKSNYILDYLNEEYMLTIQTDGCLCLKSKFKIGDFLHYDYIGGYCKQKYWWKETNGLHNYNAYQCFNGGFSLRNINAMKSVLLNFPPENTVSFFKGCNFEKFPEDLYYTVGMFKLGYNVAIDEFATNFCTHTSYEKDTFCVHKLSSYVPLNIVNKFLLYCEEYKNFINLEYL